LRVRCHEGARGAKAADVRALVDTIMKVQRLAADNAATIAELDINPLVVLPRGQGAVHLEPSEKEPALQAILLALDDAGIDASEVDGLASYSRPPGPRAPPLRGESTSQVDGATTCLVTSGEGVPTSAPLRRAGP
jgi:hypothetical protein